MIEIHHIWDHTQLCISTINSNVEHCELSFHCEHPSSKNHMKGQASPTETNPVTLLHQRVCWGCFHGGFYSVKYHLIPTVLVRGLFSFEDCNSKIMRGRRRAWCKYTGEQSVVSNFKSIPDRLQIPASKHPLETHTLQTDTSTHTHTDTHTHGHSNWVKY